MNRAIKFRQYNPITKRFHYWGFIGGGFVSPYTGSQNGVYEESAQLTGLLDKNGLEIYEGDVVVYYNPILGQKHEERFNHQTVVDMFNIQRRIIGEESEVRLEIIGNIYENPELLKEDK